MPHPLIDLRSPLPATDGHSNQDTTRTDYDQQLRRQREEESIALSLLRTLHAPCISVKLNAVLRMAPHSYSLPTRRFSVRLTCTLRDMEELVKQSVISAESVCEVKIPRVQDLSVKLYHRVIDTESSFHESPGSTDSVQQENIWIGSDSEWRLAVEDFLRPNSPRRDTEPSAEEPPADDESAVVKESYSVAKFHTAADASADGKTTEPSSDVELLIRTVDERLAASYEDHIQGPVSKASFTTSGAQAANPKRKPYRCLKLFAVIERRQDDSRSQRFCAAVCSAMDYLLA